MAELPTLPLGISTFSVLVRKSFLELTMLTTVAADAENCWVEEKKFEESRRAADEGSRLSESTPEVMSLAL
jgi:hypothetical protein